jgi:hypothetical protein
MTGAAGQGLCANCTHAEAITSSKGSRFVLCRLSYSDPRFPRYPRLPVLACGGYTPRPQDPRTTSTTSTS